MSLPPDSFSSEPSEEPRPEEQMSGKEPIPTESEGEAATSALRMPTEEQYETNGGPLGCCLGIIVGAFLTALLILGLSISFSNGAILGAATIPAILAGAALCGYLGWRIGKRVYREYELSPRQKRKLAELEKKYGQQHPQRQEP